MTARYLVGGPCNSGKSTFVLSLAEHLRRDYGLSVEAIELDVWSGSYPAFRGEIGFKDRPKKFGLEWDWQTPLLERIATLNQSAADIVIGDMPGKLDTAIDFMCVNAKADGALVVSRSMEGITQWAQFYQERRIPVVGRWLTFEEGSQPLMLVGMDRNVSADHRDVTASANSLVRDMLKRRGGAAT